MQGNYKVTTTRTMTVLDGLLNPKDGYMLAFTWIDDTGQTRNSSIKLVGTAQSAEVVDAAIKAEIEKIESWLK